MQSAERIARKPLHRPWTVEESAMLAKLLREGKSAR